MRIFICNSLVVSALLIFSVSQAQSPSKLLFREDWKEIEAALPVTQQHVSNPDLSLTLYGPARDGIKKSNHPNIPNDPFYIWSGECRGNWAVSLRHRHGMLNLNGADARVRIRSKQSGFRQLRLILKLDDGTWIVSDQSAGATDDWTETEFLIATAKWRKLNIDNVTEAAWTGSIRVEKVSEIGFTDLMAGGGTPASSRVDWIEVWGTNVTK